MPTDGTILFAKYAIMPNRLGYCGGDDSQALLDYCAAMKAEPGLVLILQKFQAAYPYLKLIAQANNVQNPFDNRVVEAYWIGNELLDQVDLVQFYNSLHTRFAEQLTPSALDYLTSKPSLGAHAHHSFHVFDVHSRIGMLNHSPETMESCRIGWGKVKEVETTHFLVEHQPLELEHGKLRLGNLREMKVLRQINGTRLNINPEIGDFISFHWGLVCDILSPRQLKHLEMYTRKHIALANQTL